jgi:hypothetical protein
MRGLDVFVTIGMFDVKALGPMNSPRDTKIHSVRPASAGSG